MTDSTTQTPLESRASGPLSGKVRVPGDKSISHRALILGALSVGETRISGLLEGEDVLNTAKSMQALGARVERTGPFAWLVAGVGVAGFAQPASPLDFGNSGTGCRLVMGAVAGCPISAVFDGDAKIPGGSLVDASACDGGWCEIAWQDKKGFAIQSALDMSGRVPQQRAAAVATRPAYRQGPDVVEGPEVV